MPNTNKNLPQPLLTGPTGLATLVDGALLRTIYTYPSNRQKIIKFGTFHKGQTDQSTHPNRVFAFWRDTADEAIKARDSALNCSTCKGNGKINFSGSHLSSHVATWIDISTVTIYSTTPSANNSAPSANTPTNDDCHCPMLSGGGIDHTSTCNYMLSRAPASLDALA